MKNKNNSKSQKQTRKEVGTYIWFQDRLRRIIFESSNIIQLSPIDFKFPKATQVNKAQVKLAKTGDLVCTPIFSSTKKIKENFEIEDFLKDGFIKLKGQEPLVNFNMIYKKQ